MTLDEALQKLATQGAELMIATARADKAEADLVAANSRADAAEGERDAATAAKDESEKARTDAADGFAAAVQERVALEGAALRVLGAEFKCDGKSDREIKVACIKSDCEGKSDDYVQARFDMTLEVAKTDAKVYNGMEKADADAADNADPEAAARKRMLANNKATFDNHNAAQ